MKTKDDKLLQQVKKTIQTLEPKAKIALFGSRARGNANSDSDWDLLVLLNGKIDFQRQRVVRQNLYKIELENNQILSSFYRNHKDWNSIKYKSSDFYRNVMRDCLWI